MKLSENLRAIAVTAAVSFLVGSPALAQECDTDALGDCLYNSGVTCRNSLSDCEDNYAPGMSVADIQELTIARCCAITGNAQQARQRACFKIDERKLAAARRVAPRSVKPFLAQARRALIETRQEGCDAGSLG
ncbi:MAG: hypothetical protein QY326_04430 [Bdellovibrionota bacterium]|nr:MAG: hypothetical protein QY326_04430 [Bdellovibrionota bacterium]